VASQVEGLDDEPWPPGRPGPRVRALAARAAQPGGAGARRRALPDGGAAHPARAGANALAVQAAYSEYQQRALARDSLRRMYIGTLTLALILAVFAAVLLAIVLGNQLAGRCCCWPTACARWPPAT
jgi:hypothetical protein